ncbi:MAG TPA: hypothetical protein VH761_05490 [Ilumatobacteraceae bacterium]|jgi:hypothetical protein
MSTAILAEQLRSRARHLRHLSSTIATCRAIGMYALAGPDTWVGPTPQACYESLLDVRRHLQEQHELLARTASAMERRAAELETAPIRLPVS